MTEQNYSASHDDHYYSDHGSVKENSQESLKSIVKPITKKIQEESSASYEESNYEIQLESKSENINSQSVHEKSEYSKDALSISANNEKISTSMHEEEEEMTNYQSNEQSIRSKKSATSIKSDNYEESIQSHNSESNENESSLKSEQKSSNSHEDSNSSLNISEPPEEDNKEENIKSSTSSSQKNSSSGKSSSGSNKSHRKVNINALNSYKKVMDRLEGNSGESSPQSPKAPIPQFVPSKKNKVRKYGLDLFRSDDDEGEPNKKKQVLSSRYLVPKPDKQDPFYNSDQTIDELTTMNENYHVVTNRGKFGNDPDPIQGVKEISNPKINQYLDYMTMTIDETGTFTLEPHHSPKKHKHKGAKKHNRQNDENAPQARIKQSKFIEADMLTTLEGN